MKKIILSFFASLLFLSQAANAEIKFGDQKNPTATLAFNAGYNSTYVWRGVDQNADADLNVSALVLNTGVERW